jgi:predicted dehydrogenase
MRFALLGNDSDGLAMACALVESGQHQLAAYTAPVPDDIRRALNADARRVSDAEEVLADPAVDMVIVASSPASRAALLRRALQAERHVLCVRPGELSVEIAYEAALLQGDTGCVLLPLLPAALHPAIERLARLVKVQEQMAPASEVVGSLLLVEMEMAREGEILTRGEDAAKPALPGWEILRALGGEVEEVSAFARGEELQPGEVILVAGRFAGPGLFRMTLLPHRPGPTQRITVVGTKGRAELYFPHGAQGPAFLSRRDSAGELREESWDPWDPWPVLAKVFESALSRLPAHKGHVPELLRQAVATAPAAPRAARLADSATGPLTWQDAIRSLELDDAARRSVERRRASALEYPQATEEAGFKGTMTLVGCAMVWGVLVLLIVSAWVPGARYAIFPLLVVFLGLQLLRYLIPRRPGAGPPREGT